MAQVVRCPTCGSRYMAEEAQLGTQLLCTECNTMFVAHSSAAPDEPPSPVGIPEPAAQLGYAEAQGGTGKAIASLVLGIIAIPTCVFYGIPSLVCGILAVVFGGIAKKEIRQCRMPPSAASMALAGVICGSVAIGLSVLFWVLIIVFFTYMAGMAP